MCVLKCIYYVQQKNKILKFFFFFFVFKVCPVNVRDGKTVLANAKAMDGKGLYEKTGLVNSIFT